MIIGITGTIGAGKGTVASYLQHKGFTHFAARDFLADEVARRGLPVNRDTMVLVADELRAEHGPAYVMETLLKRASTVSGDVVVESVRTTAEADLLKKRDGILLALDADEKTRYERVVKRDSETDHVSFDVFRAQNAREMENEDPNKQNIAAVMRMADATISSDKGVEDLRASVDAFLAKLRK